MTEMDFAELFHAHGSTAIELVFGFFSVTSAFLVAVYLAGRKIAASLAVVIVILYSFTAIFLIGLTERNMNVVIAARNELALLGATWHPVTTENLAILPTFAYGMVGVMALVFFASIWYFIDSRRGDDDT